MPKSPFLREFYALALRLKDLPFQKEIPPLIYTLPPARKG